VGTRVCFVLLTFLSAAHADRKGNKSYGGAIYTLDANASGVIKTINNIANLTVVSRDATNDLKAEYGGIHSGQAAR